MAIKDLLSIEFQKMRSDDEKIDLTPLADIESLIENELDIDFSLVRNKIDTEKEFYDLLLNPFEKKGNKIFYRGERIDDRARPLIPTIFRNRSALFSNDGTIANVNADFIFDYYSNIGDYIELYEKIMGESARKSMYGLCAFSQHYLDVSPFVDFTKSLFVALSFATKGKTVFDDDIVLYTVEIISDDDYTTDIKVADKWLENYNVLVFRQSEEVFESIKNSKSKIERLKLIHDDLLKYDVSRKSLSPSAKLIDIPTNDLMRFQQGIFLLLTDFQLTFNAYPTKSIRSDFKVTKWVIDKSICPMIVDLIKREAPWYNFDCLLDVKRAFKIASNTNPDD